ncbi:hypothetical protein L4D09_19340, partial [Photobacterium makurazakiensis]|uniref:hypothetical protein n=1 Tax=Photobacterium makurazakiensis TaxID=2910234 RepID=UPI003D1416C4
MRYKVLMAPFTVFIMLESLGAKAADLQLVGRVYDRDNSRTSIIDADLIISVSGKEPDELNYSEENGKYNALSYNRNEPMDVYIHATHPDFILPQEIKFETEEFRETKNIRLKYKPALAEEYYSEASDLMLSSSSPNDIEKALLRTKTAIELSPQSRYILFQADNIGRYLYNNNDHNKLPSYITNFSKLAPETEFFQSMPKAMKYEFLLKIGHGFSRAKDLENLADNYRTYLNYSIEAFDAAIKLDPTLATAYQGKYQLQGKVENYFDAISTIEVFFEVNNPVKSERTIKGFLVDWATYLKMATQVKGSNEDIKLVQSNSEYYSLWKNFYNRLEQYQGYFKSKSINGNKNLIDIHRLAYDII